MRLWCCACRGRKARSIGLVCPGCSSSAIPGNPGNATQKQQRSSRKKRPHQRSGNIGTGGFVVADTLYINLATMAAPPVHNEESGRIARAPRTNTSGEDGVDPLHPSDFWRAIGALLVPRDDGGRIDLFSDGVGDCVAGQDLLALLEHLTGVAVECPRTALTAPTAYVWTRADLSLGRGSPSARMYFGDAKLLAWYHTQAAHAEVVHAVRRAVAPALRHFDSVVAEHYIGEVVDDVVLQGLGCVAPTLVRDLADAVLTWQETVRKRSRDGGSDVAPHDRGDTGLCAEARVFVSDFLRRCGRDTQGANGMHVWMIDYTKRDVTRS